MMEHDAMRRRRMVRCAIGMVVLAPLLLAADCSSGSSSGSGDTLGLITSIINLVLSIINAVS